MPTGAILLSIVLLSILIIVVDGFRTNIPDRYRPRGGSLEVIPYALGILRIKFSYPIPKYSLEDVVVAKPLSKPCELSVAPLEYRLLHSDFGPTGVTGSVQSVGLTINRQVLSTKMWISRDERNEVADLHFDAATEATNDVLSGTFRFVHALEVYAAHRNKSIHLGGSTAAQALVSAPLYLAVGQKYTMGVFFLNAAQDARFSVERGQGKAAAIRWAFGGGGDNDVFLLPGPHPEDVYRQHLYLVGAPAMPPMSAFGVHFLAELPYATHQSDKLPSGMPIEEVIREATSGSTGQQDAVVIDVLREGERAAATVRPSVVQRALRGEYILNNAKTVIPFADVANPQGRRVIAVTLDRRKSNGIADAQILLVTQRAINEPHEYTMPEPQNELTDRQAAAMRQARQDEERAMGPGRRFFHTTSEGAKVQRFHLTRALGLWTSMALADSGNRSLRRIIFSSTSFSGVHRYGGALFRFERESDVMEDLDEVDVTMRHHLVEEARAYTFDALANITSTAVSHSLSGYPLMAVTIAPRDVCTPELVTLLHHGLREDDYVQLFEPFVHYVQQQVLLPFTVIPLCSSVFRKDSFAMKDNQLIIGAVTKALAFRLTLVPYLYTEAFHSHYFAIPFISPLFFSNSHNQFWFTRHQTYFLGNALVVRPVPEEKPLKALMSLPSPHRWYALHTGYMFPSNVLESMVQADLDDLLIAVKGGSIVPMAAGRPRTTKEVKEQSITLVIAVDAMESACGSLFIDDGETNAFKTSGQYIYYDLCFERGCLHITSKHPDNVTRFARYRIAGAEPSLPQGSYEDSAATARGIKSLSFFGLGKTAVKIKKFIVEKQVKKHDGTTQWSVVRGYDGRGSARRELHASVSVNDVLNVRGPVVDSLDGADYRVCIRS